MYRYNSRTRIFSSGRISDKFESALDSIKRTVESETEDYILNVNETEYVNHITEQYLMKVPEIMFEDVYADSYEEDIPAEYFPMSFYVYEGKKYKKEIIQFIIPVEGDADLLSSCPASSISLGGGGNFHIKGNTIVAEFINFNNDPQKIKQDFDNEVSGVHRNYQTLRNDIINFNNSLASNTKSLLSQRKQKLFAKNDLLSSLGVPLKKKSNTSETFSVPQPRFREKLSIKPSVLEKGFKPEPTLDDNNYRHILKLINDIGKNFERMPSVYKGKEEEDLRDHILMTLDPNFEFGSASGETFNKSGKTDIQLRYDSSVIFIAECKFWSGEKGYLKTISQLLNYLTWRDTKASVVMFVRQKDFSSILEKVERSTKEHENYLGFVDKTDENWYNYRFHINGDKNRELKLAIQLYHLPK
ncbi:hypothetical protein [Litoribacter populi]|uniref:hypothetical protein n=1 Tax=Litoribacter populi TaxID=2598460 RepID=UPI00117EA5B7|nr:hypothetical protein [Litoribacter populi]